jgi:Pyruvate/2-oxoacid:ferredoxin oxidoreductase delta subunit
VDSYAAPAPSSRRRLVFEDARDGAVSRCDVVIDLTGGQPLFSAGDMRPGYYRADPRDPVAVARLIAQASHMVGTFDKPRFINFSADLCAHSRNRKVGCTRCLDLCPAGAIAPAGDSVAIDAEICAGCGQCAAACPTGAASYALPTVESLARRLRAAQSAPGMPPAAERAGHRPPRRGSRRGPDRRLCPLRPRPAGRRHPAPRQRGDPDRA